jgi:hypothetical protein
VALARAGSADAREQATPLPSPEPLDTRAAGAPAAPPPPPEPVAEAPANVQDARTTSALPELHPGLRIGRYTVVKVGEVVAGGMPVLLRGRDGSQFGVDILRYDRRSPGVARGGRLAVYLNNGGKGEKASVEEHGLGAMALAAWLAKREARGRPVPSLLTLRERAPRLRALQG